MNRSPKFWGRLFLSVMAVCFFLYGAYRGEAEIVFNKAIHICLECIGLG